MITKRRPYLLTIVLAIVVLLLGACGGRMQESPAIEATDVAEAIETPDKGAGEAEESGEESGHEHEMSAESIDNAKTITIVATEFGFEPASIELQAGEPVNIMLVNEGAIDHELQIEDFDFHVHALPGESAMAGFTPEVSGTYEFACLLPGHYEAGMIGGVEVVGEHDD